MPTCRCARCRGKLVKDRMYDLPRKIHEFFCINCGERFWMEAAYSASAPPSESLEKEIKVTRLGNSPTSWTPSNLAQARN